MEKKQSGIMGFVEKKKEEKLRNEEEIRIREEAYQKAALENRQKEAEKEYKLSIIRKAYKIVRELGNEITRWSDYYNDIEVIKNDFSMEGIRIILDYHYFDEEKHESSDASYEPYKKNYLFIYINGDKVFESQMSLDKPYSLDKYSDSDWPKVIEKLYEFLPRLKDDKDKKDRIAREKSLRLDELREYLYKFIEIQGYQGNPYTNMLNDLEAADIAIGRYVINESTNERNEFTIKYTIYHKGNEVLNFFCKDNKITVTSMHYIQGEWENDFKKAIDIAYKDIEEKKIGRINTSVDQTLAKLKKMF